jgi:hypothetical protein
MRPLPEKPEDFDKLLAPYRVMVRPLVGGVSKIAEVMDTLPLDADEKEGGVQAFSALLYQYGGELDARVLVGLWLAGVTLPRVLHAIKKMQEEEKRKKSEAGMKPRLVEREINAPPVT